MLSVFVPISTSLLVDRERIDQRPMTRMAAARKSQARKVLRNGINQLSSWVNATHYERTHAARP